MRPPPAAVLLTLLLAGCGNLPATASSSPTSTPAPRAEPIGDAPVFEPFEATGYDCIFSPSAFR